MVFSLEQRVQREHAYAIIDEVDSILIDEARTPLIISGPVGNEADDKYATFNRQVAELVRKQTGVVNTLLAEAERLLEGREDPARRRAQAVSGPARHAQEQAPAQDVERAGGQAAGPAHGAGRHRGPEAADPAAAHAGHGGRALLRARREGALGSPDGPGRRGDVAERPRAVPRAGHLRGDPPDRQGPRAEPARPDRAAARGRVRVRAQEREAPHHPQAAAGPRPVREGSGLPGAGRPGADRGRVHRPHHDRPALGGRAPPGGGGQGAGAGQGRDPDLRHDHDPELLPDVRQAGRHDGHRRDRGDRVLLDLRARGQRHPDPPARSGAPTRPTGSTRPGRRSTTRSSPRSSGCTGSAGRS